MAPPRSNLGRPGKRQASEEGQNAGLVDRLRDTISTLKDAVTRAFSPVLPKGGFLLSDPAQRQQAIDYCWAGDYTDAVTEILERNQDLAHHLMSRTSNTYTGFTPATGTFDASPFGEADGHSLRRILRLNFLGGMMARMTNQNFLPKHALLLGLESKQKNMNRALWGHFSSLRVIPCYNWTDSFVNAALLQNPGCPYPVIDGVSAAVFDNFSEHFNYNAAHTAATQGERLEMTNWATVYLHRDSAPRGVTIRALGGGGNPLRHMFKPGFNKYVILDMCHPNHPDIRNNQSRRWRDSLARIRAGTYFKRPAYIPPHAHHLHYHDAMRNVLQSSYVDVEYEIDKMRADSRHKHSAYIFLGGDGLSIMRINWTLARNPGKYLRKQPAVIPVQGEHPHGTCHVLHMGWRPYAPLLLTILQGIGHTECKKDWTVSSFNDYDNAITILIEGVARYLQLLAATPGAPPLTNFAAVKRVCERNADMLWLVHFLHDFGFMYWDMRQAVRGNDSDAIDLVHERGLGAPALNLHLTPCPCDACQIWRECVSFMHSNTAHKTNYASMALLRIFWVEALNPHLAAIYKKNRTISLCGLPGSNGGWDLPIEHENLMISNNVHRMSFDAIDAYVRQLNFLGPVNRGLLKAFIAARQRRPHQRAKIATDVQLVVDFLVDRLGSTWMQATRLNQNPTLVNPPRSNRPWDSIAACVRNPQEWQRWGREHLDSKIKWM